jgi:predicted hydrocarbon binding protein
MSTVITISGADKTGALARIYGFLARKGYGVKGHHVSEAQPGVRLLSISIDGGRVDREEISAEIKGLSADYSVVSVASDGTDTAATSENKKAATQADSAALKEMAKRFPEIADLVHKYADAFGYDERDRELLSAGKKLGAYHYKKEWSLGAPLKMPVALRRTLVPALEKFCEVEADDENITLKETPFCSGHDRLRCCCDFVAGFMQGFLDASPATKGAHVQKVTCKANGGLQAAYTVKYTA